MGLTIAAEGTIKTNRLYIRSLVGIQKQMCIKEKTNEILLILLLLLIIIIYIHSGSFLHYWLKFQIYSITYENSYSVWSTSENTYKKQTKYFKLLSGC